MFKRTVLGISAALALVALPAAASVANYSQTPRAKPAKANHSSQVMAYRVQVTSIYDGDTFSINLPGLPTELNPVKIRLRGVDTPERGGAAKCESERARAERARAFTVDQIAQTRGQVIIANLDWDKYGGRINADVYVGREQESLVQLLVASGHGRPYDGGKRKGWCF